VHIPVYGAPFHWRQPPQPPIDWSAIYPNEVILHGPRIQAVALTFDDGPDDEWTPQVLDDLRESGAKATFFCVGQRIEAHPEVFLRMVREGHVVGNHSWNHPNLARIPLAAAQAQITRTDEIMERLAGVRPRLLRPPYGALSHELVHLAMRMNKTIILWNVDSLDWTEIPDRQVAAHILSHAGPGSIILQHSAGGVGQSLQNTVNAIPYVIDTLRRRRFAIRTVPALVNVPAYAAGH